MSSRSDVSMNAELAEPSVNTPDIAQLADEAKSSTLRRCALTIAAGLVLTAITVGSLAKWITAQWSHFPGPYLFPPPNQNVYWTGYTVDQFVGLTFFVLCCTTGYCLLWIGITTGARVALAGSSTVVAAIFLGLQGALALASIAVGLIGAIQWGGESFMKCLGIFCVNTNKYHEITLPHTVRDSAGEGWLGIIGMAAFLSLFPLGCVLLFRIVRMAMDSPFPNADVQPHDIEAVRVVGRRNRVKLIASVILSEIFLLFLAVVSFYFPDDWEYFTDARIAQSAALQVVDPSWSAEQYNTAISTSALVAAEFPWAFFKTHQVQLIANQFYLKLWPGNVMFYCYLVGILASSFIVTHTNRRWAEFWSKPMRKIHLPKALEKYFGMRMTRGEFVAMWITKWLTMVFAVYWFHDHNYNNNWSLAVGPGTTNAERWARSFGQLAVLFLSLLMFAASRNSLFHKLLGTSWESFLWAHKALGWAMLIATFLHMVLWWKQYSNLGMFPQEIFHVPPAPQETADNFTVPLIFITTMILFIAMGALTYEPIRRRAFEVFYFAHLFAAYTTIPLVLWHAASGFEYMLPGLTVWFLDRLYRASCSAARVNLLSAKSTSSHDGGDNGRQVQPAESVEFKFTVDAGVLANAQPGQYVFVNVAEISIFEWHPFTLSRVMVDDDTCLNNGRYLSLHIKAMDPGSWTYRLFQLVSKLQDGDGFVPPGAITLAVDGPVGTPFHAEQYTDVVLIGGGIGITPVSAIFDYFKRARVPNFVTPAEGDAPLLSGERRLHALWALREEPLLRTDLRHCLAPWTHDVETRGVEGLSSIPMFATQSSTVFLTRFCDEKSLSAVMNSKELSPHARSITMACGRPNVDRLLRSHLCVAESAEPEIKPLTKPIVFVCGPEPLVQSVMQWCDTFGVPVHRETFLL